MELYLLLNLIYCIKKLDISQNFSTLQEIVGPFSEISVMRRIKSHAFDSVKRLQYCSKVMQTVLFTKFAKIPSFSTNS